MKKIILILTSFLMILSSCGIFRSSSKESSSSSSVSILRDDIYSFEIVRLYEDQGTRDDIVFTNGGFSKFSVEARDVNNELINISIYSVEWKSSNTDIFTVDSFGGIKGKNNGVATLKAYYCGYEASKEITIETIAYTFTKKENELEYRKGSMYYFPLEIEPSTASLFVEISDPNIITLTDMNNIFSVVGIGTCEVTITAYTSYLGEQQSYTYQIDTIDGRAPTFYFKNQKKNKGDVSFAKNKYKNLAYSDWGIKAISYDGGDITSLIEYYSGDFDLSQEGHYVIMLIVTDYNRNASTFFELTLDVSEYELVSVHSPIKFVNSTNFHYELVKASPYTYLIDKLIFYVDIEIISDYEYVVGTICWYIQFYIEIYSNGQALPYDEEPYEYKFEVDKDSPRKHSLVVEIESNSRLDPDTFSFISHMPALSGYAYYYRYY
ncbi:MAG: hypothetical protein ACI4U5_06285 [Bacilli bacterium]